MDDKKKEFEEVTGKEEKVGSGYLKISAYPFADIVIDGRKIGEVPPRKIIELSSGVHEVILKKDNMLKIKKIHIKPGETEEIFYSFKIKQ